MGKFFGDVKGVKPIDQREALQSKYNAARTNLIIAIAFTVLNTVMLFIDGSSYFLFSIFVPYFLAVVGMLLTGKLPELYYTEEFLGIEYLDTSVLVIILGIALGILGLYLISWIFSKKNRGSWLIFALVLFVIDTALMLFLQGVRNSVIDVIFHIWVIVSLTSGIIAYFKLKKLPEEEIIAVTEDTEKPAEITDVQSSTLIRIADLDAKAKILLQAEKDGMVIIYRRVKRTNELVINGNVYDEYEALIEKPHNLVGVVGGRTVEAGLDGVRSYIKIDGETIAKKVRLA